MNSKTERLADLVKELRGSQSQAQFAKKLGISRSSVTFWESGQAWPDTENLQKLAFLKGMTLGDLQIYLIEGELPTLEQPYQLDHILNSLRLLPREAVVKVANAAVDVLANKTFSA